MNRRGHFNVKKMGNRLNNKITAKRMWQVGGSKGTQYDMHLMNKSHTNRDYYET